jgi:exonuclease SbcD
MKILHTSDWHIGSTFYGKKRYREYNNFFAWLHNFIQENQIDILLISGDIFDTALPGNTAQEQYYSFLIGLQKTSCKHVIITAGNHDSPSFLTAPKNLLKSLNIHVIGTISQPADEQSYDEIIGINENNEEIIILAVPFLRERDLQTISITDDYDTRAEKIVQAIKNYYAKLTQTALAMKKEKSLLLAMGHLAIAGSVLEEEGERELYIGTNFSCHFSKGD